MLQGLDLGVTFNGLYTIGRITPGVSFEELFLITNNC